MAIDLGQKRTSVTMIPANGPKKTVYPFMKFKNPSALDRGVVSAGSRSVQYAILSIADSPG